MQFIPKGPDIPEELLRFHEEGRVVFFCGSGVSMNAHLPDFKGLVKQIWKEVGNNTPSAEEKLYMRLERYDAALGYLENKFDDVGMANDAGKMRHGLATVLSRWRSGKGFDRTHRALLTLAKTRGENAQLHLVTTNFDRLFEEARKDLPFHGNSYVAPLIPIPRTSNWDGIVYLHGLLPDERDESALKNLVVTSGDFGRAYLKERWAVHFVSELFREFVVCFVGYSLSDPVMRYLVDAIDADKSEGEYLNPIFLFATTKEADRFQRSKSITCIPYSDADRHRLLHETLSEWSKTYSNGSNGREAIIDSCADIDPNKTHDDWYIGRMIWALSDTDGVGARRFARHNPVPSLHWAKILLSDRGLVPVIGKKKKIPLLRLSGIDGFQDIRQEHIWNWFLKHLAEPEAAWLVASEQQFLHPRFRKQLSHDLTEQFSSCNNNFKASSSVSSSRSLSPEMHRLWRLILAGKVVRNDSRLLDSRFDLLRRLQNGEWDYGVRKSLRTFLTPVICLERLLPTDGSRCSSDNGLHTPLSFFDWNLDLTSGHGLGESFKTEINAALHGKLADFFEDAEAALLDGLEALHYLDPNGEHSFAVVYDIPSIEDHSQNRNRLNDWPFVVALLRDAWLELADTDKDKALSAFRRWIRSVHPVFRRLGLFAAKRSDIVVPHEWFESLTGGVRNLLWSATEQREVLRLLATSSQNLSASDFTALSSAIAEGPPSDFLASVETHRDVQIDDHKVWLRLKKVECCGRELPEKARQTLESLSARYPTWSLLPNQREEFSFWVYGTGDPDFEAETQHILVPETPEGMDAWLIHDMGNSQELFHSDDNWKQMCREKPVVVLGALHRLADRGKWNARRISDALQVWREDSLMEYGLDFVNQLGISCPDDIFTTIARSVAFWCEDAAKKTIGEDEWLMQIAKRIFALTYEDNAPEKNDFSDSDPVGSAINHPVGMMTEALLDRCFGKTISKGEGIPALYRELFATICSDTRPGMRHGRVILASRAAGLYLADDNWTRMNLLPLFDWERNPSEARAAWHGFLWPSRVVIPLMQELKKNFLMSAGHIKELGDAKRQYCSILTLMGLWHVSGWRGKAQKEIFTKMGTSELEHCAETLMEYQTRWFDSDADKRDDRLAPERIWTQDVFPFIHDFWPTDTKRLTKRICDCFAQLIVATGKEFPHAQQELGWILKGCEGDESYCLYSMKDRTQCLQVFPEESLDFLLKVSRNIYWMSHELKECLDEIEKANPALSNDERFLKLLAIASREL